MKDLKRLCSERVWQLWSRIWIQTLIFLVVSGIIICYCFHKGESRDFIVSIQAALTGLLTALGTYIVYEWNAWNRHDYDEKVFLKSVKEELACFNGRDLDNLKGFLQKSSDHQNRVYVNTRFEYRFPVYENTADKLGLVIDENMRMSIVKVYSMIYHLAHNVSFTDGECCKIFDNNYCHIQNITLEETNERLVKLKNMAGGQLRDLEAIQEYIRGLVAEIEKYVK